MATYKSPYSGRQVDDAVARTSALNYNSTDKVLTVNGESDLQITQMGTDDKSVATKKYVDDSSNNINIKNETPTGALSQLKDGTTFTFINPNSQYNNENLPIGASEQYATSLGGKSRAKGKRSLATGTSTFALGDYSHAEGNASISEGIASHVEGLQTTAKGDRAHAEGQLTLAVGSNAHAEGYSTVANSYSSHTEGAYTKTGVSDRNGIVQWVSMSAGSFTVAEAAGKTLSVVSASVSRGTIQTNIDSGSDHIRYIIDNAGTVDDSHKVLVRIVYAINGSTPTPPGPTPDPSVDSGNTLNHAEGYMTQAFGAAAHSEGHTTAALGQYSHAEGIGNVAFGLASHVEGANNEANGKYSHAGGSLTKVNGMNSIAVGGGLKSNADNQAIFGEYNLDNTSAFVIGNGDSDNNRTDLFKVNETGVYYKNAKLSTSDDLAVIKGAGTASFKTSNSTVANQGSAAIGYGTTATAWGSLSFGASSKATQSYAVAGGQASEANAEHSFAFGEVVKTTNQYQVAFGKYNAMKTDTLFEIGNGTSSKRENVFEVHADGHVELATTLTSGAPYKGDSGEIPAVNGGIDIWGTEDWAYPNGGRLVRLNKDGLKFGNYSDTSFGTAPTSKFTIGNPMSFIDFNAGAGMEDWGIVLQTTDTQGTAKLEINNAEVTATGNMKIVNGNLQIGNTTLTESQLQKLLALLDAMEVK